MNTESYLPRLVDAEVEEKLANFGAINITGCKWCGKTRTARQHAKSFIELQDPENKDTIPLIKSQPSLAMKGDKPRLIDEWQDAKEIWDAVRHDVDRTGEVGQYILTGSATPRQDHPKHSGAGRIATIHMRPMSLYESGDSNGQVSLESLFDNAEIEGESTHKIEDIAYLCTRGGWPSSIVRELANPSLLPREYLKTIVNREDSFDELEYYSPGRMQALLRSFARNTASPIKMTTLLEDVNKNTGTTISDTTLANYFAVLEQIYLVESVEAWSPELRSKTEIRTTKKRIFVDPSLATASLYASLDDLIFDSNTFGLIFENLVLRDLKIYAESLGGEVFYYYDRTGLEIDATVHLINGSWGAIEVKLGSNAETIDNAVSKLLKFRDNIDSEKTRSPAFLAIISGDAKYAYRRREDGIYIIPVGCLKP